MTALARTIGSRLPAHDLCLDDLTLLVYDERESAHHQRAVYECQGVLVETAVYHSKAGLLVIATVDPTRHGLLLHVSMSYRKRSPSWAEIKRIKTAFFGVNRDAMMLLPRDGDYINVHDHCFHLWETPVGWGIR